MPVGTPTTRTSNSNLTRNELIEMAYSDIKVLAEGEPLSSGLLATGIQKLNLIIREHDLAGKHLWAIPATPTSLTLLANTFMYAEAQGIPATALQLVTASYRDGSQGDTPLQILTTEQYEGQRNKLETGDPRWVYLTEHTEPAQKTLFIGPTLSSVNTQSVVTGTDAIVYKCIRSHTADSTNRPITGANYLLYWEAGGSSPGTWTTGTSYTAPQLLRLWFKRPLYDFDAASDNPDMPQGWVRWLNRELMVELAPGHNKSVEEINVMRSLRNESHEKVFRSVQPNSTEIHNKTCFY